MRYVGVARRRLLDRIIGCCEISALGVGVGQLGMSVPQPLSLYGSAATLNHCFHLLGDELAGIEKEKEKKRIEKGKEAERDK